MPTSRFPFSPRSLWSSACLVSLSVLAACGASTGGGGEAPGLVPKSGHWQGTDLGFDLKNSQVSGLTLAKLTCTGDKGCTGTVEGPQAGSWGATMRFLATPAGGSVDGRFISETAAAGTLTIPAGTCCNVVAAWSANWVGDGTLGGSDAAGGTDGGTADAGGGGTEDVAAASDTGGGSLAWNGASLGTIHPGPARADESPAAPAGAAADQAKALELLNAYRTAVGSAPVSEDSALNKACKAHSAFYVANVSKYNAKGLSPHKEDATFGSGFTGVDFWDRCKAAGYTGFASGEVIAFEGTPAGALQGWIDTVYHRLPLLDPVTTEIGFGSVTSGKTSCDTIDSASRNALKTDPIVVYPWPGQHKVPSSWNGLEGPTPPSPPGGFPSGPVVTAQFPKAVTVTAHTLTNAAGTAVAHTWLDKKTDANLANLAPETVCLYSNKPLSAGEYTVTLTLSTEDILSWRFTVGP